MYLGLAQWAFRAVCFAEPPVSGEQHATASAYASAEEFLRRFGSSLDVTGKRVLDVRCGTGELAIALARRGAHHVHGVDIRETAIQAAERSLIDEACDSRARVTYQAIERFEDLVDQRYDVVVANDAFEHLDDPDGFVECIERVLTPDGELVITVGPLWKSPYGGHLTHMTRLPWAHLVFSERVIMRERHRFSSGAQHEAARFERIAGGQNRMTYARFVTTMTNAGFVPKTYRANVKDGRAAALLRLLRRVPSLHEYMTFNVYSIWHPPHSAQRWTLLSEIRPGWRWCRADSRTPGGQPDAAEYLATRA